MKKHPIEKALSIETLSLPTDPAQIGTPKSTKSASPKSASPSSRIYTGPSLTMFQSSPANSPKENHDDLRLQGKKAALPPPSGKSEYVIPPLNLPPR